MPRLFSRARLAWAAAGLAAVALGVLAYSRGGTSVAPAGGPVRGRPNVLLVTIDTLRDDRVTPSLTPAIGAVAARGVRFTQARTVAPLTLPAHTSLLTGVLPPHHGVRLNGVHRLRAGTPTLATVLHAAGYDTAAFVGAYVLDRRFGLAEGFTTYDDEIARSEETAGQLEAERRGAVVADRAIAWLRSRTAPGSPFFLWVHLYDPHAPYEPPDGFVDRATPYDGEVAYADAQVGRVLDALTHAGMMDRTVVVVAGDHGESLGEHGEATHGLLLYEPALRIPLVVAGPGIAAGSRQDVASLVDVAPTVASLLNVALPRTDGRNLFAPPSPAATLATYSETHYPELAGCSPLQALVSARWKYIGGPADAELYDLQADPGETGNVAAAHGPTVAGMSGHVGEILAGSVDAASAPPSREAVEKLRALGYVATAAARPSPRGGAAPSPTTIVRDWGAFHEALAALSAGRQGQALASLAALARRHPGASVFQSAWARSLAESGRAKEAVAAYRQALERWPQDADLLHGLATAARDAGLTDEAVKAEEAAIAVDPAHAAAHNGLGLLMVDAGRADRGREAFERAVALDPHAVPYLVNLGNARRAGGDLTGAEASYREALRLAPASPDAANGLGVLLVQTGRAREAVPVFEGIVARDPDYYESWLNLGIARQTAGDPVGAAAAYRRVLRAPARFAAQRRAAADLLGALGSAHTPAR